MDANADSKPQPEPPTPKVIHEVPPDIQNGTLSMSTMDLAALYLIQAGDLDARLSRSTAINTFTVSRNFLVNTAFLHRRAAELICNLLEIIEKQNGV